MNRALTAACEAPHGSLEAAPDALAAACNASRHVLLLGNADDDAFPNAASAAATAAPRAAAAADRPHHAAAAPRATAATASTRDASPPAAPRAAGAGRRRPNARYVVVGYDDVFVGKIRGKFRKEKNNKPRQGACLVWRVLFVCVMCDRWCARVHVRSCWSALYRLSWTTRVRARVCVRTP